MLLLGILSIVQISFLPGYLLSQLFHFERLASKILFVFCISTLFNFLLVFLLTSLGFYTIYPLAGLVLIECGALIFLGYRGLLVTRFSFTDLWRDLKEMELGWSGIILLFLFFIAVGQLLLLSFEATPIFAVGDSVVSWNRWAVDWATNRLPLQTWLYPQLLPANWSVSYVFIGDTEINFFAKFVMNFFPFGIVLIFWDLFLYTKRLLFILGGVMTVFLLFALQRGFIFSGYVDIPLAFYCLTVFYFLYLTLQNVFPVRNGLLISAAILSAASLTKQPGLFMAFPFSIFCLMIWMRYRPVIDKPFRLILSVALICAACILPWYVYNQVQIYRYKETSNLGYLTSNERHHGMGYMERLQNGTSTILDKCVDLIQSENIPFDSLVTKRAIGILVILLLLASLFDPAGRISFLAIGLPYYIIWGTLFSYDLRNVSLSVPFISIGLATGIVVVIKLVNKLSGRLLLRIGFAIILILLIAGSIFRWNKDFFYKKQVSLSIENLGPADLNKQLYSLLDSTDTQGMVVSNYWFLPHLPGINKYSVAFDFQNAANANTLEQIIRSGKSGSQPVRYILISKFLADAKMLEIARTYEQSGTLKNIFQQSDYNGGWSLFEIQPAGD